MVQSVLGANSLKEGQIGTNFIGWLKILDVPLFILPGIICYLLYPDLTDENEAYMTLVTGLLPTGMVGLIMAVLITALISTIDSALNSFSTIFTLDIYSRRFNKGKSAENLVLIGRMVSLGAAFLAILIAVGIDNISDMDLFSLFQAILGYLAPPMSAVFLLGVLWPKMTAKAANIGLVAGSACCLLIGVLQLSEIPYKGFWPHFLLVSFFLFVFIILLIIVVTIFDKAKARKNFPTLAESYISLGYKPSKKVVGLWGLLFVAMIVLYIVFN